MSTAPGEPSQAARLEDVAEAGMGADDTEHAAKLAGEDDKNGSDSVTPQASSGSVGEQTKEGKSKESERSVLKIVLIMASLCVSYFNPKGSIYGSFNLFYRSRFSLQHWTM